jgi:hypothetical protein
MNHTFSLRLCLIMAGLEEDDIFDETTCQAIRNVTLRLCKDVEVTGLAMNHK